MNTTLPRHKSLLDLSSIQLDESHTPSKRGESSATYQGRKNTKLLTCNCLLIAKVFPYRIVLLNNFITWSRNFNYKSPKINNRINFKKH